MSSEINNFWDKYTIPSVPKRILLIILVFLQFYPTKFLAIPVSSRVILSVLGLGLLSLKYIIDIIIGKPVLFDRRILSLGLPLFLLSIFSTISLNYNGTNDTMYLYYFVTSSLMISSAYFTINIFRLFYKEQLSFEIIAYYCITAIFIQLIFGIITYVDDSLTKPLSMLTEDGVYQYHNLAKGRFLGLGCSVMLLGVANGIALLLISILLKNYKKFEISSRVRFYLSFIFVLIALLGNMQARTTLTCGIVCLMYLSVSSIRFNFLKLKNGFGQLFKVIILLIFISIFFNIFFSGELSKYQSAMDYGFEIFYSIDKGQGAKTGSSETLKRMLTVWPNSDKTWLIGDGIFTTPDGGYYMQTDVGYARLIFYFGVFGAFAFYIYELLVTYLSFKNLTKDWLPIWLYLVLMIGLVNVKAFIEYTHYVALFLVYNILYLSSKKNIVHEPKSIDGLNITL